jgi:hypothetical protein
MELPTMYKHTQIGLLMYLIFLPIVIGLLISYYFFANYLILVLAIFMAIALFIFNSLSVELADGALKFYFGPGIIRNIIPLGSIISVKSVRNSWYFGWGIHWFGRGWLYNVSGFDAVELQLNNNKVIRIGTDEPRRLENAIKSALKL